MRPESLTDFYALVPLGSGAPREGSLARVQADLSVARSLLLARSTARA